MKHGCDIDLLITSRCYSLSCLLTALLPHFALMAFFY